MIIPRSPLLRTEDYDSTIQAWIGRLLSPLNTFISSVTSAINGNLTFTDNMVGLQKTLSFSYASNTLPMSFAKSFTGTAQALEVVGATEDGVPVIVSAAWGATTTDITITDLVKFSKGAASVLKTGSQYNLTVRVSA